MIEALKLRNFKCFLNESIDFAPLTLLAGASGAGKSSVLQACLALQQSYRHDGFAEGLILNGELVKLGTPDDVLHEHAVSNILEFALKRRTDTRRYGFARARDGFSFQRKNSDLAAPFPETFSFLSAERAGPRAFFPLPTPARLRANPIGHAGQYAAFMLARHGSDPIPCRGLLAPPPGGGEALPDLLSQTEAWLSRIGQAARVHVREYPGMDGVNLEFSFPSDDLPSARRRAANVGFGLICALPVFSLVLHAKPGTLILLENPGAHLHPRGQSVMGRFLARAAACGMQIVVETHSDHLLNGLRLAVKNGELPARDTALSFFTRDGQSGRTRVLRPQMDEEGRLDIWPDHDCDGWEKHPAEPL